MYIFTLESTHQPDEPETLQRCYAMDKAPNEALKRTGHKAGRLVSALGF